METHYNWKIKFFSNTYEIYKSEMKAGEILNKAFSRSTTGVLNGKNLIFDVRGFFRSETKILDGENESMLAELNISNWKSRATIVYNSREYIWQYENFWNTKWTIGNENGALVKYHSFTSRGEIQSFTDDPVLILTGLFIKNYFRQRAASAAAAST